MLLKSKHLGSAKHNVERRKDKQKKYLGILLSAKSSAQPTKKGFPVLPWLALGGVALVLVRHRYKRFRYHIYRKGIARGLIKAYAITKARDYLAAKVRDYRETQHTAPVPNNPTNVGGA